MIVLLVIIAVLVIIAFLRLGAVVRYDEDGLFVSVFAGPVRITLIPRRKKESEDKKKKRRKKKETDEAEDKDEKKQGGTVRKLLDIISAVSECLRRLRKRLSVDDRPVLAVYAHARAGIAAVAIAIRHPVGVGRRRQNIFFKHYVVNGRRARAIALVLGLHPQPSYTMAHRL